MMNFKIEINYLNIDNYPRIESHLENLASQGWLLHKIFLGTIFIYKKIEPEEFDFSISPYELETAFTRKSKDDLEEFHSVSKHVGWNYATKSYDLHIYYKPKDSEEISIHTDDHEEFKAVKRIAKRYLRGQYVLLPIFLIFTWFIIGSVFNNIHSMKNGFIQIGSLLMPFGILISIIHIFELRSFLKRNRKNIESGKSLEFNNSNHLINKFLYSGAYIIFIGVVIYLFYSVIVLNNLRYLIALLPVLIGGILGTLYRFIIKPLRKGLGFKMIGLAITLVLAGLLASLTNNFNFEVLRGNQENLNPTNYRVLMFDDFMSEDLDEEGNLVRNASLLIPSSHEYTSHFDEKYLQTEYSKSLNESLAENLVDRYIEQTKNRLRGNYSREIERSFDEGIYHPDLKSSGLTEDEFNRLYNMDSNVSMDTIWNIINEQSITEDNQLWDLDEVYFLNYEKDEVVLRDEKEVFYLSGMDFSDSTIVEMTKSQLELN